MDWWKKIPNKTKPLKNQEHLSNMSSTETWLLLVLFFVTRVHDKHAGNPLLSIPHGNTLREKKSNSWDRDSSFGTGSLGYYCKTITILPLSWFFFTGFSDKHDFQGLTFHCKRKEPSNRLTGLHFSLRPTAVFISASGTGAHWTVLPPNHFLPTKKTNKIHFRGDWSTKKKCSIYGQSSSEPHEIQF